MYMMVCCVCVGLRGSRRGWQLFRMSMSAMIVLWVCEPRVSLLEKALSYSARSAARPWLWFVGVSVVVLKYVQLGLGRVKL